jgi:hypothetical protein
MFITYVCTYNGTLAVLFCRECELLVARKNKMKYFHNINLISKITMMKFASNVFIILINLL